MPILFFQPFHNTINSLHFQGKFLIHPMDDLILLVGFFFDSVELLVNLMEGGLGGCLALTALLGLDTVF